MSHNSSVDQHVFELNEVVRYQRWNQCLVVGVEVGGDLILQSYDPDNKKYIGTPFRVSRFSCSHKLVLDRSMLNVEGCELPKGPYDPAIREMIDRIKNMAD